MPAGKMKYVSLADIIALMENIAPLSLAEEWDNVGLQVGATDWPVRKIWVALDPLLEVIKAAGQQQVDMVITHHPLIFHPLKRLDFASPVGKVIETAITSRTAIFAAHTNLDSAIQGINDTLACMIGLKHSTPLIQLGEDEKQDSAARQSVKVENALGLGRIGDLAPPLTVRQLAEILKHRLGLDMVKVAGDSELKVQRAAVCSGSGASLMDHFLKSEAQVYISGDLRYQDARIVEDMGRALIDVGHFASEHIMVESLAEQLNKAARTNGWTISVEPYRLEQDPFYFV